ncbi:aurora kinase-like [Montipora foliosa]|uniref:aurora kinase-like n=1 Tax=Montipora foliosa TaxID=591990 RepID=UPI0035F1DAA6
MSDVGELKEGRYRSRPHSKEEKKKQKRDWEKRRKEEKRRKKREKKRAKNQAPCVNRAPEEDADRFEIHAKESNYEDEKPVASKRKQQLNIPDESCRQRIEDEVSCSKRKKREVETINEGERGRPDISISKREVVGEKQALGAGTLSRGKKLLSLAKLKKRSEVSSQSHLRVFCKSSIRIGKTLEDRRKPEAVQELDVSLLVKVKESPIGSGTFGNVFLARYRGMKAVIKEIKMRGASNSSESQRCKQEVLHEGKMLRMLGEHPNLPFLFGVVTQRAPCALVMQFHGTGEESITLHKVVKERIFNKQLTAEVFTEIAQALRHIHAREIVHNDLKANNVIIQQEGEHYRPIIIDFGKSEEIVKLKAYKGSADYLAPEVMEGKKQSPASDIFSFGKMLQLSVSGRSFFRLFTEIIVIATSHRAEDRPSANDIVSTLRNIVPISEK